MEYFSKYRYVKIESIREINIEKNR